MLVRARGIEALAENAKASAGNRMRRLDTSDLWLLGNHVVGSGSGFIGIIAWPAERSRRG
jgi:hypothetical protein